MLHPCSVAYSDATPTVWSLTVGEHHTAPSGSLHSGCTAAIVDVLGTSVIAMGDPAECGVAINLDVQVTAPVAVGEVVAFEASVLKRGGRLVFVEVCPPSASYRARG